jgi:hypothetical protein
MTAVPRDHSSIVTMRTDSVICLYFLSVGILVYSLATQNSSETFWQHKNAVDFKSPDQYQIEVKQMIKCTLIFDNFFNYSFRRVLEM